MDGWIKSYRSMFDNPIVCKDADHYAVWGYLLHNAAHKPTDAWFGGKRIILQPGQLVTGRKIIALKFRINESKVRRVLDLLKSEHQIDRQTTNASSLITVLNWDRYQATDQQNDQQIANDRPTNGQRVTTLQEVKNERNKENTYTHTKNDLRGVQGGNPEAMKFLEWIKQTFPDIAEMKEPLTVEDAEWLIGKYDSDFLKTIIASMHNNDVSGKMGIRPPEKVKVRAITTIRSYIANAKKQWK